MMNEGYPDWLGIAPEGKFPVRKGTATEPAKFTDRLERRCRPASTPRSRSARSTRPTSIKALQNSPDTFQRWGFPQKQGALRRRHAGRAARAQGDQRR